MVIGGWQRTDRNQSILSIYAWFYDVFLADEPSGINNIVVCSLGIPIEHDNIPGNPIKTSVSLTHIFLRQNDVQPSRSLLPCTERPIYIYIHIISGVAWSFERFTRQTMALWGLKIWPPWGFHQRWCQPEAQILFHQILEPWLWRWINTQRTWLFSSNRFIYD